MEFLLFVLHKPYLTLAAVLKECYGCKVKLVKSGNPYYRYFCNIHLACYRCYFFCMLLSLLINPICVPDNTASNKEWKKKPHSLEVQAIHPSMGGRFGLFTYHGVLMLLWTKTPAQNFFCDRQYFALFYLDSESENPALIWTNN